MMFGNAAIFISRQPSVVLTGTPVLSNFNIENDQQSRVYFDASADVTDMTIAGFYINERSLTLTIDLDGLGGYFTSTTPFKYGEIVTIECRSGDGTVYDFPKDYVTNNIIYSGTEYYVTPTGAGSKNGLTIGNAFDMTALNAASISAPARVNIQKGSYSGSLTAKTGNSTTKEYIVYEGYNIAPGDVDYSVFHPAHDAVLDATIMPLFTGINSSDVFCALASSQKYVIFKNLQVTNYYQGFKNQTAGSNVRNIFFDNIVITEGGSSTAGSGYGILMNYNPSHTVPTTFTRVVNTTMKNHSGGEMNIYGNDAFVYNTKVYSDRTNNTADADYTIAISAGHYIVIRNCHAEKIGDTGHDGHGISFRGSDYFTEASSIQYSTIINCSVKNIIQAYQFRHTDVKNNFLIGSSADGVGANGTQGIVFRDGASNNVADRCIITNCVTGILYYDSTEDTTPNIYSSYNNIVKNCIFDTVETGIRSSYVGTPEPTTNNFIYNCTFKNITTDLFYANQNIVNLQLANNIVVDSDCNYFSGTATNDETWSNSIFYNNTFTTPTGGTVLNPLLNASYQPQVAFTSVDATKITGVDKDYNGDTREAVTTIGAVMHADEVAVSEFDYYVSAAGSGNGLTEGAPMSYSAMQALTPSAGTTIALKGGDEFYGQLSWSAKSGSVGNPITFTSYGTGEAIIKGSKTYTSWTNTTGNIWEASTGSDDVYGVIGKTESRKPVISGADDIDANYLFVTSFSSTTQFICSALVGFSGNIVGAKLYIRTYPFDRETRTISGFNSGTGQITISTATVTPIANGDDFFIRDAYDLLASGQYYYNSSTHKLYVYSVGNPGSIEAVTLNQDGIYSLNSDYVTFDNIKVKNFGLSGIKPSSSDYNVITNCTFEYTGKRAVYPYLSSNTTITDNVISNNRNNGIFLESSPNTVITGNTISEIYRLAYMGETADQEWDAIYVGGGSQNTLVQLNNINNVGFNGVSFYNVVDLTVDQNTVSNFCLNMEDGAGIYGGNNSADTGTTITYNDVTSYDSFESATWDCMGIYLDDGAINILVDHNTTVGAGRSLFLHNTQYCDATYNNFSGSYMESVLIQDDAIPPTTVGNTFTHNTVANNSATYMPMKIRNTQGTGYSFVTLDYNTYLNTGSLNSVAIKTTSIDQSYTLAAWKTLSSQDLNSTDDGAGTNVVTNGTFDSGTGWTLSGEATIGTGKLNLVRTGGSYTSGTQTIAASAGKTYSYSFDAVVTSNAGIMYLGDNDYVYIDSTQNYSGTITNTSANNDLLFATSGVASLTIDNVVLIEQ